MAAGSEADVRPALRLGRGTGRIAQGALDPRVGHERRPRRRSRNADDRDRPLERGTRHRQVDTERLEKPDAVRQRRAARATGTVKALKGARYALWQNPENLTERQVAKLAWIAKTDPRLHRAYLLKEGLRHVLVGMLCSLDM